MIRRGICRNTLWQRDLSLWFIGLSFFKIFIFDIGAFSKDIMCSLGDAFCSGWGIKLLQGGCFSLFICTLYALHMLRKHYGPDFQPPKSTRRNDNDLRFWANLSMTTLIFLACWLCAPFVWYLIAGYAPQVFFDISWHFIATLNFIMLLVGFWKAEDCYWYYEPGPGQSKSASKVWVPRDTLWLVLAIYLTTVAFGVMADDVLH